MESLNDFRKKLCPTGRNLFDICPPVSASYGQFNKDIDPLYEESQEETLYKKHIIECEICSLI